MTPDYKTILEHLETLNRSATEVTRRIWSDYGFGTEIVSAAKDLHSAIEELEGEIIKAAYFEGLIEWKE